MGGTLSVLRAQVHVPNTCAWCQRIQDVIWYCNDCREVLCDRCFEAHQRARKTRKDVVVPIKEATRKSGAFLPEVCTTHPGKACDLFCTNCNVVMCSICSTIEHKGHTFKHLEEEIDSQNKYIRVQLKNLKSSLDVHHSSLAKRHDDSQSFKESADDIRQDVETQRMKLKAEIDSIADSILVELSSLDEEEENSRYQNCRFRELYINDIEELIRDMEQQTDHISFASLLEKTWKLRTTVPMYVVAIRNVLPRRPRFMPGERNADQIKSMIGYIHVRELKYEDCTYEKKEIDSHRLGQIAAFSTRSGGQINSICPIDDKHAWLSMCEFKGLIKVTKRGKETECVNLDFEPYCLTMINTKELLITHHDHSTRIHKLSKGRRVTVFTDISPFGACGISVNDSEEVFVTTRAPEILVLNLSGETIRQISFKSDAGLDGLDIICLTKGNIAVTAGYIKDVCEEVIFMNKTDEITHKWSGELDNGQKLEDTTQCNIARDRFDRVFVPDNRTNQVYVLSANERKAKCLLDKKHGVVDVAAVCVDRCGHVWIGCRDGTVHVMELETKIRLN